MRLIEESKSAKRISTPRKTIKKKVVKSRKKVFYANITPYVRKPGDDVHKSATTFTKGHIHVGLPPKWNLGMVDKAYDFYLRYFEAPLYVELDDGKKHLNPLAIDPPWLELLSLELNINQDTVTDWSKDGDVDEDKAKWKHVVSLIKQLQLIRLQNRSMYKESAAGSIFLMKANHGKLEINRNELTGKDGKDLNFNVVNWGDVKVDDDPNNK